MINLACREQEARVLTASSTRAVEFWPAVRYFISAATVARALCPPLALLASSSNLVFELKSKIASQCSKFSSSAVLRTMNFDDPHLAYFVIAVTITSLLVIICLCCALHWNRKLAARSQSMDTREPNCHPSEPLDINRSRCAPQCGHSRELARLEQVIVRSPSLCELHVQNTSLRAAIVAASSSNERCPYVRSPGHGKFDESFTYWMFLYCTRLDYDLEGRQDRRPAFVKWASNIELAGEHSSSSDRCRSAEVPQNSDHFPSCALTFLSSDIEKSTSSRARPPRDVFCETNL